VSWVQRSLDHPSDSARIRHTLASSAQHDSKDEQSPGSISLNRARPRRQTDEVSKVFANNISRCPSDQGLIPDHHAVCYIAISNKWPQSSSVFRRQPHWAAQVNEVNAQAGLTNEGRAKSIT
jgi:hypothetical protein